MMIMVTLAIKKLTLFLIIVLLCIHQIVLNILEKCVLNMIM